MAQYEWDFVPLSDFPSLCSCNLDTLPDTCYWKDKLKNLFLNRALWSILELPDHHVYLLSGPVGTGRHMVGNALLGEYPTLCGEDPENVNYLRFRAEDFPASLTVSDALDQIATAFERCDGALNIIVFDDMDLYAHSAMISNAVADWVIAKEDDPKHVVVACYVEDESRLSYDLRAIAFLLHTNIPSERQRTAFLHTKLEWEVTAPGPAHEIVQASVQFDDLSLPDFVSKTEGLSYAELELLMKYIRITALNRVNKCDGLLMMSCDERDVDECLHMVKNTRPKGEGQFVQIQQMVANGGAEAVQVKDRSASISSLAMKQNRSFQENLELMDNVLESRN